jgi:arylsulfatase A-like enzyme
MEGRVLDLKTDCTFAHAYFQGVNDVTWNNPRAGTHVLDILARKGVILDNFYTLPICTPSRAALLTGIYPFRYGLQVTLTSTKGFKIGRKGICPRFLVKKQSQVTL